MANDGLLPQKFFADIHPRFRTPWKNTILVGIVAGVVGSLTPIENISKMVNIGTLLAFVIVCVSVLVLRRTNPGQSRPFRTPWVPVVPLLGILFNGYMMYKLSWINWTQLLIWLAIGTGVYFGYSRHHSKVREKLAR
jgi:APA family basic amino acid/polyamine antiporter